MGLFVIIAATLITDTITAFILSAFGWLLVDKLLQRRFGDPEMQTGKQKLVSFLAMVATVAAVMALVFTFHPGDWLVRLSQYWS